ncbi:hypothetical protein ACOSP7_032588 [Xanthoceras sorbifolium]
MWSTTDQTPLQMVDEEFCCQCGVLCIVLDTHTDGPNQIDLSHALAFLGQDTEELPFLVGFQCTFTKKKETKK